MRETAEIFLCFPQRGENQNALPLAAGRVRCSYPRDKDASE